MAAVAYYIKMIGLYGSQYSPNNRVGIELPPSYPPWLRRA